MSMHAPPTQMAFASTRRGGARCKHAPGLTTMAAPTHCDGLPMTPSFAQFRIALLGATAAFAVSACATLPPPTAELNEAQASVVRATGADADQYAPESIATARDALSRAQAAMAEGREDDARRMALASDAEADLAYARSRHALAQAELAQRRAEVEHLQQRLQRAGGGR